MHKTKTAIRQLIEKLKANRDSQVTATREGRAAFGAYSRILIDAESHLPEERQQIIDAYKDGIEGESYDGTEYFNSTFESHDDTL